MTEVHAFFERLSHTPRPDATALGTVKPVCFTKQSPVSPPERDGLIASWPRADKRNRIVSVTCKGRKLVEEAEPTWRQAQEALLETLG